MDAQVVRDQEKPLPPCPGWEAMPRLALQLLSQAAWVQPDPPQPSPMNASSIPVSAQRGSGWRSGLPLLTTAPTSR